MHIEPTIKNILSQSWLIFQENINNILIVTIIIGIPLNIMLYLIPMGDDLEGSLQYYKYVGYVQGLFGILATIAIAFITRAALEHEPITWQESIKLAFNKWLQVIGTNFLESFLLVILFLLLVVPGIVFAIFWYFVTYITIFTDKWGMAALKQSKVLVKNRWWKSFGFIMLFTVMALVVGIIAGIPLAYLPENVIFYVLGGLLVDIAVSFFSVLGAVFYFSWEHSKIEIPVKTLSS